MKVLMNYDFENALDNEKFIADWNKNFDGEFILSSLKNKRLENVDLIQGDIESETLAVDEFLSSHDYKLERFTFSHTKPSFFVK